MKTKHSIYPRLTKSAILATIFMLVMTLAIFLPTIQKMRTLARALDQLDPPIASFVQDGILDASEIDKLLQVTEKFTYESAHPCDPEVRDCSTRPSPTEVELKSDYMKYGYPESEYTYISVSDMRANLQWHLEEGEYKFSNVFNPDQTRLELTFVSNNKSIGIVINLENNPQEIEMFIVDSDSSS